MYSRQPECVYSVFKRLGTELVLGLFLNIRADEQPELFEEIAQLCTQHWHGKGTQWKCAYCTQLALFAAISSVQTSRSING